MPQAPARGQRSALWETPLQRPLLGAQGIYAARSPAEGYNKGCIIGLRIAGVIGSKAASSNVSRSTNMCPEGFIARLHRSVEEWVCNPLGCEVVSFASRPSGTGSCTPAFLTSSPWHATSATRISSAGKCARTTAENVEVRLLFRSCSRSPTNSSYVARRSRTTSAC